MNNAFKFLPVLFLLGCQEPEFRDSTPEIEAVELQVGTLAAHVEEMPEPNRYRVVLSLPALRSEDLMLYRLSPSFRGAEVLKLPKSFSASEFIDDLIQPGVEYTYELRSAVEGPAIFRAQIKVPRDFIVRRLAKENEVIPVVDGVLTIEGYRRLFFESEAILETKGLPLEIAVDSIFAQSGFIQSWAINDAKEDGDAGASAGEISISAKVLNGELQVQNRGQRGGRGQQGVKGAKGEAGAIGASTAYGNVPGSPLGNFCSYAGDKEFGWRFARLPSFDSWSSQHPGKGRAGSPGGQGGPGAPGLQGGDGGVVRVMLESGIGGLKVSSPPGVGGEGGVGGPGGDGGDGGAGGVIHGNHSCDRGRSDCCRPAPAGDPGPSGEAGSVGPNGPAGQAGVVWINGIVRSGGSQ